MIDWIEEDNIIYCKLKRSHRILGQNIFFKVAHYSLQGRLIEFPRLGWMDDKDLSQHLYLEGAKLYNINKNASAAIEVLRSAIQLNDKNTDAYEALGVILGHQEKYNEAIKLMKTLAKIDPNAVMPHTNLSLFYMKQGLIEKAEEEKAQATILGMKQAGRKAKKKKQEQEDAEKKQAVREKMYHQVLDIDPNDFFANYSLANICLAKNDIEKSIQYAKRSLESNEKHSSTYLVLGKALEAKGDKKEAIAIYKTGAQIAASQGETKLANEMQAKATK